VVRTYSSQLLLLLKRLTLVYLVYFICRLVFFIHNRSQFQTVGPADFAADAFYGLRFDSFSIAVSNSLFILLSILPVTVSGRRWYQQMIFWTFIVPNIVFTAANLVDVAYFPFTRKRSSADLFRQLGGQTDVMKLLPQFLADFWWVLLLFVVLCWVLVIAYRRIRLPELPYSKGKAGSYVTVALLFLLSAGLTVLAVRGGLQRVPIDIVNAGTMTRPEEVPILLNTPFTLIKSVNQEPVKEVSFYSESELKNIYDPIHVPPPSVKFEKLNVVVLILESFSKEYTKLGGKKDLTPFLDSLMDHSLLYTNGYSNGTKSIEGIPAILSSLPSLMNNPFINSIYANNQQTSFATLLAREGYETGFFHGGINGTMNFDDWAALAGYGAYYGRNEYMNDEDFDGYWGIWDEPFLQFSVKKMNEMKQPFHSAIFTLSSHHPYLVPRQWEKKLAKGPLENSQSIRYADLALKKFFETARHCDWYDNTLFVLTADHCGISEDPFYSNAVGFLSIPVLFFRPDNSLTGTVNKSFSQIDILPRTMNLLGYGKPFFAFGGGFRDSTMNSCFFYDGASHLANTDSMLFCFRGDTLFQAFNFRRDSLLHSNVLGRYPRHDSLATAQYRSFIQTYNRTLIRNSGTTGK
jgi:phosphoglycerol transferase MdoB-like AlkP superfamily enzyme